MPLFFYFSFLGFCAEKIEAVVFYSPRCAVCLKLKEEFLKGIILQYQDKVVWNFVNIHEKEENLSLLMAVSSQFKKEGVNVPAVLVGDTFLIGYHQIKNNL